MRHKTSVEVGRELLGFSLTAMEPALIVAVILSAASIGMYSIVAFSVMTTHSSEISDFGAEIASLMFTLATGIVTMLAIVLGAAVKLAAIDDDDDLVSELRKADTALFSLAFVAIAAGPTIRLLMV